MQRLQSIFSLEHWIDRVEIRACAPAVWMTGGGSKTEGPAIGIRLDQALHAAEGGKVVLGREVR